MKNHNKIAENRQYFKVKFFNSIGILPLYCYCLTDKDHDYNQDEKNRSYIFLPFFNIVY